MRRIDDHPKGRHYETPSGVFPSVTTVLSRTGDKSFLDRWISRVGEAEAERVRQESAARGSRLHEEVEHRLEHGVRPPNPSRFYRSFEVTRIFDRIEKVHAVEEFLWHPQAHYAGTVDLVATVRWRPSADPIVAVIDWKSSAKKKRRDYVHDYFLQGVAYALAWRAMEKTPRPTHVLVGIGYEDSAADYHWVRPVDFTPLMADWASRLVEFRKEA